MLGGLLHGQGQHQLLDGDKRAHNGLRHGPVHLLGVVHAAGQLVQSLQRLFALLDDVGQHLAQRRDLLGLLRVNRLRKQQIHGLLAITRGQRGGSHNLLALGVREKLLHLADDLLVLRGRRRGGGRVARRCVGAITRALVQRTRVSAHHNGQKKTQLTLGVEPLMRCGAGLFMGA